LTLRFLDELALINAVLSRYKMVWMTALIALLPQLPLATLTA